MAAMLWLNDEVVQDARRPAERHIVVPLDGGVRVTDHFPMGQAAMQVNEGLPGYIVDTLNSRRPLLGRTLGILGMAFKGESDDPRASLSYKLRKLAQFKGAPALVVVVQQPSQVIAVVVGPACGQSGPNELYSATIGP